MGNLQAIYDPTTRCANQAQELGKSLDSLAGRVVGFLDNTKPNFNYLIDDLADLFVSKYRVASVVKRGKRVSSIPAPDSLIKELSEECDVVITGSGD